MGLEIRFIIKFWTGFFCTDGGLNFHVCLSSAKVTGIAECEAVGSHCSRPPVFPTLMSWNSAGKKKKWNDQVVRDIQSLSKLGTNLGKVVIVCRIGLYRGGIVDIYHQALGLILGLIFQGCCCILGQSRTKWPTHRGELSYWETPIEEANSCKMDLKQKTGANHSCDFVQRGFQEMMRHDFKA